jgi:hypothetical protein
MYDVRRLVPHGARPSGSRHFEAVPCYRGSKVLGRSVRSSGIAVATSAAPAESVAANTTATHLNS